MRLLMKRLVFWMRESALHAKFRLYERWPALFPHALDMDEQDDEMPDDAAEVEYLEQRFKEHKAAEPTTLYNSCPVRCIVREKEL